MQSLATMRGGAAGKGIDALTMLLHGKDLKAGNFLALFQRKNVEGANKDSKPAANIDLLVNGSEKRVSKAQRKDGAQDDRVSSTLPTPAIPTPIVVSITEVEIAVPASAPSPQPREAAANSNASPQQSTGASEAPAAAITFAPEVSIDEVGQPLEKGDRPTEKKTVLHLDLKTALAQAHYQTDHTSHARGSEIPTSPARPEPPKPNTIETAENRAITASSPDSSAEIASGKASLAAPSEHKQPQRPDGFLVKAANENTADHDAANQNEVQRPSPLAVPPNEPRLVHPSVVDPADVSAGRSDAVSKKTGNETEKVIMAGVHKSQSVAASSMFSLPPVASYSAETQTAAASTSSRLVDGPIHHTMNVDAPPTQAPAAFHSLRLAEHIGGPELHFKWNSPDAGNIQLSTSLHHRDLQILVNTDRADTAAAMRAELPSLDSRLHDHALRLGEVNIVAQERSISTQLGMSSHDRGQRDWNTPPRYAGDREEHVSESKADSVPPVFHRDTRVSVLA